jgi:hypothetical protein
MTFIVLCCSLLIIFSFTTPLLGAQTAQKQEVKSLEEIQKRIQKLRAEAERCKDPDRLDQIMDEIEQLDKAYEEALDRGEQPAGAAISAQEAQVREALKSREDEPCYPVLFEKEYAVHFAGSNLPWVTCVPLAIRLVWEIEERWIRTDKWPTGIITYTLEENYPGFLRIKYDQKTRSKIEAFTLAGPSPKKKERVYARFTKASASGLLAETNPLSVPVLHKTVGTTNLKHFLIDLSALPLFVEFFYDSFTLELRGGLSASKIDLDERSIIEDPFHLVYEIPQHVGAKGAITLQELQEGLRKGILSKSFRVDYTMDLTKSKGPLVHKQTGSVALEVRFNAVGALSVSPADGFKSKGPDDQDNFNPDSKTYTLKNTGDVPLQFAVSKSADWLGLSASSGTLAPKEQKTITISINKAQALSLSSGVYNDSVSFTNATNGSGNTSRPAELKIEEEQRWQVTVSGFEVDDSMAPTSYKDKDETTKSLIKKVRFDWKLGGSFILRKEKGVWTFKSGKVTSASVSPIPEFAPSGIYQCQVVVCPKKAPITSIVGSSIFGHVSGGNIQLHWPPAIPSGCVQCKTNAAGLPKTPYEAEFQSVDFTTQIGLESHALKDGYSRTFTKKKWLQYTLSLKKLK